jgi:hypothetical protein
MSMIANPGVVRGPESWNYIYRFLGFALAIEGTTIGMVPLSFPWNIIVYGIDGTHFQERPRSMFSSGKHGPGWSGAFFASAPF